VRLRGMFSCQRWPVSKNIPVVRLVAVFVVVVVVALLLLSIQMMLVW
jgi:hypothetical protein